MCNCEITAYVFVERPASSTDDALLAPPEKTVPGQWNEKYGLVFSSLWCGSYSFISGAFRSLVLKPKFCPECG